MGSIFLFTKVSRSYPQKNIGGKPWKYLPFPLDRGSVQPQASPEEYEGKCGPCLGSSKPNSEFLERQGKGQRGLRQGLLKEPDRLLFIDAPRDGKFRDQHVPGAVQHLLLPER
jgi:hypothetical protein